MKTLNYLVAGMIGAGSFGIFGNNGYGQENPNIPDSVKTIAVSFNGPLEERRIFGEIRVNPKTRIYHQDIQFGNEKLIAKIFENEKTKDRNLVSIEINDNKYFSERYIGEKRIDSSINYMRQFLDEELKIKGKEIFNDTLQSHKFLYREDVPVIDKNNENLLCNILYINDLAVEEIFISTENKTNMFWKYLSKNSLNNKDSLELYVRILKQTDKKEILSLEDKNKIVGEEMLDEYYNQIRELIFDNIVAKLLIQFDSLKINGGKEIFNGLLRKGKETTLYKEDVPYIDINNKKSLCNILYCSGYDSTQLFENIYVDTYKRKNLSEGQSQKNYPEMPEIFIQKNKKTGDLSYRIYNSEDAELKLNEWYKEEVNKYLNMVELLSMLAVDDVTSFLIRDYNYKKEEIKEKLK